MKLLSLHLYIYNQVLIVRLTRIVKEFFCLYFFKENFFSLLNYNMFPFVFVNKCAPPPKFLMLY